MAGLVGNAVNAGLTATGGRALTDEEWAARQQAEYQRALAAGEIAINPATGRPWTAAEQAATEGDNRKWYEKAGDFALGVGESFADAATFGGYSSVVAPTIGRDSDSVFAGAIESTGVGDINRKAAQAGADYLGLPIDVKDPNAPAGGGGSGLPGGGPVGQFGQEAFDEWGDRAAFSYQEALDASQRSYTPGAIRNPTAIRAPEIRDVNLAPVERVSAAGPAPVTGFDAAQIEQTGVGPAETAVFGGVGRAAFNQDPQAQLREQQVADIAMLREGAAGRGPLAGRDTYAAALGRLSDEQMSIVNQATGEDKAAARLEAIQQIGRQGTIAARDAAAMDAQAQQGYAQQLAGATQGARAQDVDVASQVAQLTQQANNLDAQLRQATAMGNVQEINRLTALRGQIEAQRAEAQATLTQGARQFGAGAQNTSSLDYTQRLDAANATNAGAANKRETDQAGLRLTRDTNAGAQSIDAQTTTNQQGVDRDVAADAAGRGAFTATTDARLGGINAATSATNAGISATSGKVDANTTGYKTAIEERAAQDKRDAAEREGNRVLVTGAIDAYNSYQNRQKKTA
jgi:hypothetical protein